MPGGGFLNGAINSAAVVSVPRKLAATIFAFADWFDSRPTYWLTSAAADRAARMTAAFAGGTGFQRFSLELQYINVRLGASGSGARRARLVGAESLT